MQLSKQCLESKDGLAWNKIKGATFPGTLIVTPEVYFSAGPWYKYTESPKL